MSAAQFVGDAGEGEPVRDLPSVGKTIAKVGTGDGQRLRSGLYLVDRCEGVGVGHVDHHLERHHLDPQFVLVGGEHLLRLVGLVEGVAVGTVPRAGMVSSHY